MDQTYSGVLLFCNDVRRKLGRKPVASLRKGIAASPFACPIAATINYGARSRTVKVSGGSVYDNHSLYVITPEAIVEFIRSVDKAEHPELIGSGWAA